MLAALLSLVSLAPAQSWGPVLSAPVGAARAQAAYEWRPHPGDALQLDLFRGGRQIGAYDARRQEYRPLLDYRRDLWGAPGPLPCPLPDIGALPDAKSKEPVDPPIGALAQPDLFGVDWTKIRGPDHYSLAGKDVTRRECMAALARGLEDDTTKPHLTILCSDKAKCDALVKDLQTAPELAPWKERFRVQTYDPRDKVAAAVLAPLRIDLDKRLSEAGLAVYFQPPEKDGKSPVAPIYGYQSPALFAQALRAVDPLYDPNKNPSPGFDLTKIKPEIWLIGGALVALLIFAPRKDP